MTSKLLRPLVAGVLLLVVVPLAPAQNRNDQFLRSNPQLMATLAEVVAKPSTYTVRIKCDNKDAALGTIIAPDGWIVTKFSELKAEPVCKLKDGRELSGKVIGINPTFDLAMIKVDARNLPAVEWRDSKAADVGAWVASVGIDKEPVAVGVVSVASRTIPGRPGPRVAPNPNSGYLGVMMEQAEGGVKIKEIMPNTAASKAGLKVDDLITAVNDQTILDLDSMMETLAKKKPGDKVVIKVVRDGKHMELTAELGRRPANANRGDFQNAMGSALSERRTGFPTILQHDTVIKPIDCGGPLVDLDGKTVGINIARAGRTESYAIPSEVVLTLLDDLKAGKQPPPPFPKKPTLAEEKLKAAEEAKAKILSDEAAWEKKQKEEKAAWEKKRKEAEDAIKKAKDEIEAEKKKDEKKPEPKKVEPKKDEPKKSEEKRP
jgi:serine protease Do